MIKRRFVAAALLAMAFVLGFFTSAQAVVPDWPNVFDPFNLVTLNLTIDPTDWETVQNDETNDLEVPAMFWADGEAPILISVRKKSSQAFGEVPGFVKVALKLDINQYVNGQMWHGLRKLSLENGSDSDVVSEGLAWHLHRMAAGPEGYGYSAALASWVRVIINGIDTGLYTSVEQRDKRLLQNRNLWVSDQTWLYKVGEKNGFTLEEGGPLDSPTVTELCYSPFADPSSCPTPDLATELPPLVNMDGILTLMAVDSFTANPDAMLTHGKNFFFADFTWGGHKRLYFPWDTDSVFTDFNSSIYSGGSDYSTILDVPAFRAQYSQILNDLVCGPMSEQVIIDFLNQLEPILSPWLDADPNNNLSGSASDHFDGLRNWISNRVAVVSGEIDDFDPCAPGVPGDITGDGFVNIDDLLALVSAWGQCPSPCAADVTGDGVVNIADLLFVIANWG
ncbi:MAG: CotH kinase family protein [Phycisphaerales bacterium]|nr:CotH kinase family protein [Phycisphaerales bacterium]MCI0632213.1 CotH kinase family protein [Phycisphaerales bacterium]MCI0676168.1 CotH kinase family protein [Phycisphaerales bacterium]